MGIRESLLNTITSVSNSDFVRIVTSAGASSKATVQNLFKSFETGLGAKSSLTTSDYVRVVGSDDVAYKQSVEAFLVALGINASARTLLTSSDDLNNVTSIGYYYTSGTSLPANAPQNDAYNSAVIVLRARNTDIIQLYMCNNHNLWWWRSKFGDTWRAWTRIPTQSYVDSLNEQVNVLNSAVKKVVVRSSSSAKVPYAGNPNYASFVIVGFAQGVGSVVLAIKVGAGAIQKVRDLTTNTDFSSSYLTFSYSNGYLTISSTSSDPSYFTVTCG